MIVASFKIFLRQILADAMLAAVIAAPFMAGAAFRFGLPLADRLLLQATGYGPVFAPWALLTDLFLCILTPYMFCFASSMVMLEERDSGTAHYLMVTPVGRSGYVASRLFVPAAVSAPVSAAVVLLFGSAHLAFPLVALLALCSSIVAVLLSLLIVSFAGNKVEGMALAKLAGLILAGLPLAFFPSLAWTRWGILLPSWWIARIALGETTPDWAAVGGFALCAAVWFAVLWTAYARRNR